MQAYLKLKNKLHICILASWLPNKYDAYEGDFILRHAEAIATVHKVTVLFVIEYDAVNNTSVESEDVNDNLKIIRVYLPAKYKSFFYKHKYYTTVNDFFENINKFNPVDIIHAQVHWRAGNAAYK